MFDLLIKGGTGQRVIDGTGSPGYAKRRRGHQGVGILTSLSWRRTCRSWAKVTASV